jgi:hypothetical protein
MKLWLNGYLGHFFAFAYLGNINWLAIPLIIFFAWKFKPWTNTQKALLFFYVLALILIGLKGFFNRRYPFTMLPFTIGFISLSVFYLIDRFKLSRFIPLFVLCILMVIFLNDARYSLGMFSGKKVVVKEKQGPGISQRLANWYHQLSTELAKVPGDLGDWSDNPGLISPYMKHKLRVVSDALSTFIPTTRVMVFKTKPDSTIRYLQSLPLRPEEKLLTNNLPFVYYYAGKKAIYYWAGDDDYFHPKGKSKLVAKYKGNALRKHLRDDLHVSYIVSLTEYDKYNADWKDFVDHHCRIAFHEVGGYVVYEVPKQDYYRE